MKSTTQRTLALLRKEGWTVAVVEVWNQWSKRRNDLFGFIDVLAIRGTETLAVQCTTTSNQAARRSKILEEPRAAAWVHGGTRRIEVWGWKKSKGKWVVTRTAITEVDLCLSHAISATVA